MSDHWTLTDEDHCHLDFFFVASGGGVVVVVGTEQIALVSQSYSADQTPALTVVSSDLCHLMQP
jgi:hypothetical protein